MFNIKFLKICFISLFSLAFLSFNSDSSRAYSYTSSELDFIYPSSRVSSDVEVGNESDQAKINILFLEYVEKLGYDFDYLLNNDPQKLFDLLNIYSNFPQSSSIFSSSNLFSGKYRTRSVLEVKTNSYPASFPLFLHSLRYGSSNQTFNNK